MDSMQGAAVNASVFLLCFAFGFLISGKRDVLTLSTRVLLIFVIGLAATYALIPDSLLRGIIGTATLISNTLFFVFGCIDYVNWAKKRSL